MEMSKPSSSSCCNVLLHRSSADSSHLDRKQINMVEHRSAAGETKPASLNNPSNGKQDVSISLNKAELGRLAGSSEEAAFTNLRSVCAVKYGVTAGQKTSAASCFMHHAVLQCMTRRRNLCLCRICESGEGFKHPTGCVPINAHCHQTGSRSDDGFSA